MGVSKNNGTPKSSILIGFSIINHSFWGTPIFGNTHIDFIDISLIPLWFHDISWSTYHPRLNWCITKTNTPKRTSWICLATMPGKSLKNIIPNGAGKWWWIRKETHALYKSMPWTSNILTDPTSVPVWEWFKCSFSDGHVKPVVGGPRTPLK